MSEHIAAPRITAPNLDAFVNKHVSIVGKVTQLRGDQATIDADGNVTILLNRVNNTTGKILAFFFNIKRKGGQKKRERDGS